MTVNDNEKSVSETIPTLVTQTSTVSWLVKSQPLGTIELITFKSFSGQTPITVELMDVSPFNIPLSNIILSPPSNISKDISSG